MHVYCIALIHQKKQLIEEKARASYKEWCVRKQRERMELEKRQLEEQQRKVRSLLSNGSVNTGSVCAGSAGAREESKRCQGVQ